jgi:dTMP kinase
MGRNGLLICIEGLDKSGKTTQSLLLVDALRSRGLEAVYTTEPSAGEIGSFIKRYVLRRKQRIPASVEALLFAADRVDHVEREIKPMLKEREDSCFRQIYLLLNSVSGRRRSRHRMD